MDQAQPTPGRITFDTSATNNIRALPGFAYSDTAPTNAGQDGIRGNLERKPLNQA